MYRFLGAIVLILAMLVAQTAVGAHMTRTNLSSRLHFTYSLFGSSPAFAEEAADSHTYYKVADSGANLRDEPSSRSNVVSTLAPGALVLQIEKRGAWVLVDAAPSAENADEHLKGWVWIRLLVETGAPDASSAGDPGETGNDPKDESKPEAPSEEKPAADKGSPASGTAIVLSGEGDSSNGSGQTEAQSQAADFSGVTASTAAGSELIALITAENVNLRSEPNLRSKVIGSISTGTKVYIVEKRKPWYLVSIPSQEQKGWVFGDFVKPLDYVIVIADDVNLREKPSESSKVVMQLKKGMRFVKKAWQNNFILVASPDKGYTGWVHQRYVQVDKTPPPPTFVVAGFSVNFRKDPSVTADVIDQLDAGTKVLVLGREEKWSLVKRNGKTGWMYSEFLLTEADYNKRGGARGVSRSLGTDLIDRALSLRGTPYRWSGESLSGFDCSGFIYYLIQQATGVQDLPRSAADMFDALGVPVDIEDLKPGDLVFFTTYKAGASHVGLYLGDGDFVHASSAQGQVTVSNMSEGYYREHFIGARRIAKK